MSQENPQPELDNQTANAVTMWGKKDEITSHSSALTNLRIHELFISIDHIKIQSWFEITEKNIRDYYSKISNLYDNVFMIMDSATQDDINFELSSYLKQWFESINNGKVSDININITQLIRLDKVNWIIRANLQKKSYFFREGEHNIKKIEDGLSKLVKGGGIFGGISRISK
jgi:hypothetical protein